MGGSAYAKILTAIIDLRLICAHGRDLLSEGALKTTDGMMYHNHMEIGEEDTGPPTLTPQQAYEMLDSLNNTNTADCFYYPRSTSLVEAADAADLESEDDDGKTLAILHDLK
ncbi:hypothetical protein NX059_012271 [Plenodomus lindquistii]|nr:hypothetical protein NX059_012271 [Plenodomus lindquistii]